MRADYCSKFNTSQGTILPLPFVPGPLSEADAAPLPAKSQRKTWPFNSTSETQRFICQFQILMLQHVCLSPPHQLSFYWLCCSVTQKVNVWDKETLIILMPLVCCPLVGPAWTPYPAKQTTAPCMGYSQALLYCAEWDFIHEKNPSWTHCRNDALFLVVCVCVCVLSLEPTDAFHLRLISWASLSYISCNILQVSNH